MKMSIKNYIILMLIFFTLLPFVLLRIIAYPKIQSDLKTVIMDNLDIVGKKQAVLASTWMLSTVTWALLYAMIKGWLKLQQLKIMLEAIYQKRSISNELYKGAHLQQVSYRLKSLL